MAEREIKGGRRGGAGRGGGPNGGGWSRSSYLYQSHKYPVVWTILAVVNPIPLPSPSRPGPHCTLTLLVTIYTINTKHQILTHHKKNSINPKINLWGVVVEEETVVVVVVVVVELANHLTDHTHNTYTGVGLYVKGQPYHIYLSS